MTSTLTQEIAKAFLDYNPETGKVYWKYRPLHWFKTVQAYSSWNTKYLGTECGSVSSTDGYRYIYILNQRYVIHQIIFLLMNNRFPDQIDHINHIRDDNRSCNLREVTAIENARNHSLSKQNTSGITGVRWKKRNQKWEARVCVNRVLHYLGLFTELDDAIQTVKRFRSVNGFHQLHGLARQG